MKIKDLVQESKEILSLKNRVKKSLSHSPDGYLRAQMLKGKYPQYYYLSEEMKESHAHGTYIKKENLNLAQKLAQKEYDQKVLKYLDDQEKFLQYILAHHSEEDVLKIYEKMPEAKRRLVKPYMLSDEEFLKQWYENFPGQQNTFPIEKGQKTERGEIVRSKTEKMIADKFFYRNIPYIYEPRIQLGPNVTVCPDFLLLNIRTRKMFFLEHCGMLDDPEYCKNLLEKIDLYEEHGIYLQDTLS